MAAPLPADCILCGAPSKLRCSSCAIKSGIDLYFCSKEHQKLVWPFHRLVCGERAHPFRLPPFSQEEADLLLARLAQAPTNSRQAALQTQFLRVIEGCELLGPDLQSKVRQLIGQDCAPACMHGTADESGLECLVRSIRKFSSCWYTEFPAGARVQMMPYSEGFVKTYDDFTLNNAFPIATNTVWFSTFCHRLSSNIPIVQIIEDVLVANGRFTTSNDWLFMHQQQSLGSLLRFLHGPKDAEAARFGLVAIQRVQKAYEAVDI